MIRMELLSSVYIRAIILCIGFLFGMYKAYNLKISYRTIIDVIVILLLFVIMSKSLNDIVFKMASYLIVSFILLIVNHKIEYYYALLFSFVILFMMSISDLIAMQVISKFDYMQNAIATQDPGFAGIVTVVFPSIVVAINYYIGGVILSKIIKLNSDRVKIIYLSFSAFYVFYILQLSSIIEKIVVKLSSILQLTDLIDLVSIVYVSTLLIPFSSILVLRVVLKNNLLSIENEKKLLQIREDKINGYRFTHNFDNILLSINHLAKQKEFDQINRYLDKL